jgi:hypothetical protein
MSDIFHAICDLEKVSATWTAVVGEEPTWSHMLGFGELISIFILRTAPPAGYFPFLMFSNSHRLSSMGLAVGSEES